MLIMLVLTYFESQNSASYAKIGCKGSDFFAADQIILTFSYTRALVS